MGANSTEGPLDSLTPREVEVLRLLALGHTNVEIAEILSIATRTVEAHREHVQQKLGARTRAQLVRVALDAGLLESGGL
jgi:two-component system response regulator NreC